MKVGLLRLVSGMDDIVIVGEGEHAAIADEILKLSRPWREIWTAVIVMAWMDVMMRQDAGW